MAKQYDNDKESGFKKHRITKTSNAALLGGTACDLSHLENEVITLAMAEAQISGNRQRVTLYPSSFEKYGFSVPNLGQVFQRIKAKKNRINHAHYIYDELTNTDKIIWMFDKIEYHKNSGALEIVFTESFSEHFNLIKPGLSFTKLSLPVHMGFETTYGKRLYEILAPEEYKLRKIMESNFSAPVEVEIYKNLYDLKFQLGCIKKGYHHEMDDMVEQYKDSFSGRDFFRQYPESEMYVRISGFKERVLNVAIKDFDRQIKLGRPLFDFTYRFEKSGRGGGVTGIFFKIFYREGTTPLFQLEKQMYGDHLYDIDNKTCEISEDGVEVVKEDVKVDDSKVIEVMKMFQKGEENEVSIASVYGLLQDAGNDVSKIRMAYDKACTKKNIDNLIGYMRTLIREGEDPIPSDCRFDTVEDTKKFRERSNLMFRQLQCEKSNLPSFSLEELRDELIRDCESGDVIREMPKYATMRVAVRGDHIEDLALVVEIGDYLLSHFLGEEYENAAGMYKAGTLLPRTGYDIKKFIWKTLYSWKYRDSMDDFLETLVDYIYELDI